jgi:hypothetical protein
MSPARLVFIDETGAATNMARRYGRSPRGRRLDGPIPHGHWKSTTFVGGLTTRGFVAPYVLDGAINGTIFRAWVEQMLAPELRPDVTLEELRAWLLAAHGVTASVGLMHNTLLRLGLTRKKSPGGHKSRTGPMSPRNAMPGTPGKST